MDDNIIYTTTNSSVTESIDYLTYAMGWRNYETYSPYNIFYNSNPLIVDYIKKEKPKESISFLDL